MLCTLGVALNEWQTFALPRDFSRLVTVRAENDLRGVRQKHERHRAFKLCTILTFFALALMGGAVRGLVIDPLFSFLRAANRLISLAWHVILEISEALLVVLRVLARALLAAPAERELLVLLAFLGSTSLLLFLIVRYHRTQIID